MISFILAILRAHSTRRRYLLWWDSPHRMGSESNIQSDWLQPYVEEERLRIALLRRLHRLRTSISRLESEIKSAETIPQVPAPAPPAYTESPAQTQPDAQPRLQMQSHLKLQELQQQLAEANRQYCLHQRRIRIQWEKRPTREVLSANSTLLGGSLSEADSLLSGRMESWPEPSAAGVVKSLWRDFCSPNETGKGRRSNGGSMGTARRNAVAVLSGGRDLPAGFGALEN